MTVSEENVFDISFELDDKKYKGWVNPSGELNEAGVPTYFHVILNEASFGYLTFKDCKWTINEERPSGLVKLVGKQIEKHYQL